MAGSDTELINAEEKGETKKTVKRIIAALVVAGLGIGGYFYYNSRNQDNNTYLAMAAATGSIVDKVEATGTVTPLREVDLYFKQQGTLKALYVEEGDTVKAGQLLAVQDDTELRAAVEQAKSDLLQAQYSLRKAQLEYEKQQETYTQQEALYESGGISETDLKQARRDLENAAIAVDSARIAIQTAKAKLVLNEADLANAQLRAPFDGIAAQVNGEVGQDAGNSSSPLFHLISSELSIKAKVNEADIGRVKVGQEVLFTVTSFPNQQFHGTVSWISPQSEAVNNVQMYDVEIAAKDMNRNLLAGMTVTASIIVNKVENVTVVPTMALTYAQNFLRSQRSQASSVEGSRNSPGQYQSRSSSASGEINTARRRASSGASSQQPSGEPFVGASGSRAESSSVRSKGKDANRRPLVVLENGKPAVKWVRIGLSDNQYTEIKEGINPGEQVVIGARTEEATSSTSSRAAGSGSSSQNRQNQWRGMGGMGGPMGPDMH